MLVPVHWLFKLPIAKDRVRFLRLYSGVSFVLGIGIGYAAHRPVYKPTPSKPSFLYKLHLKRLLWTNKISQNEYEKYLDFKKV
ncbi:conserved hypothetical protein [Theileria orientalis strain Shintoku]|uniref:Uncharacterized protein n=1 Tax=Theileria orientalis strain Shintoku TaxID=869250 RepID=J4C2X9_THEOR|nr:conserved hypothetical protein [Theileria orientalis strain Shintoku]PVC54005.1 hypothetical protein MACL_00003365 [Theileria orientalis]BAM39471.1 conserved hypothetical protein [Theileria orientalis strain Shintoku]|eukprot:XP_009689772.1 conserved hypothetical protein [Theileria orientalis strain Shintoku]